MPSRHVLADDPELSDAADAISHRRCCPDNLYTDGIFAGLALAGG